MTYRIRKMHSTLKEETKTTKPRTVDIATWQLLFSCSHEFTGF